MQCVARQGFWWYPGYPLSSGQAGPAVCWLHHHRIQCPRHRPSLRFPRGEAVLSVSCYWCCSSQLVYPDWIRTERRVWLPKCNLKNFFLSFSSERRCQSWVVLHGKRSLKTAFWWCCRIAQGHMIMPQYFFLSISRCSRHRCNGATSLFKMFFGPHIFYSF